MSTCSSNPVVPGKGVTNRRERSDWVWALFVAWLLSRDRAARTQGAAKVVGRIVDGVMCDYQAVRQTARKIIRSSQGSMATWGDWSTSRHSRYRSASFGSFELPKIRARPAPVRLTPKGLRFTAEQYASHCENVRLILT